MGSGKTTIGKLLSKKLNKLFFDSDYVIEESLGVRVPMIFEYEGEEGFRDRESKVLNELVLKENIVLATGGGIILSSKNRELLSSRGIVIYLKSDYQNLAKRMVNDKTRPLLQNEDIELTFKNLFKVRDSLYSSIADYEVNTNNKSIYQVEQKIRLFIENYENN
jgi:shikimate kinase